MASFLSFDVVFVIITLSNLLELEINSCYYLFLLIEANDQVTITSRNTPIIKKTPQILQRKLYIQIQ